MTIVTTNTSESVVQPPLSDSEARELAGAIAHTGATQPADDALKFVEQALQRTPQHPLVLNAAAGFLQRLGKSAQARELYQRAVALDPDSKVLWLNLATACRALGDTESEIQALTRSLAIEPRYVAALLHKAELLERSGRPKAAVQMFEAALASISPGEPFAPSLRTAIAHARQVVAANGFALEEFLDKELQASRQLHAAVDQHRHQAYQDILLGKRRAYASLPKDSFFPYLPAIEFFPRELFPWLGELEAATQDIAAEALAALHGQAAAFSPYVDFPPGTPLDEWAPLNHSMDWSVYSLWHDGNALAAHQQACPKTSAVLARLPMCDVPGYAPGAYFSVLKPHTRLPAHTGTTNTRSIVHLPLVIPEGCRFRVGSQQRAWVKGQAWVFDDTIEHDACNDSDHIRIVLIFDVWNPLLSAAERDLVRATTEARGRYYGADAPTMGSR
jgi:aspartate beta-hydroxylase